MANCYLACPHRATMNTQKDLGSVGVLNELNSSLSAVIASLTGTEKWQPTVRPADIMSAENTQGKRWYYITQLAIDSQSAPRRQRVGFEKSDDDGRLLSRSRQRDAKQQILHFDEPEKAPTYSDTPTGAWSFKASQPRLLTSCHQLAVRKTLANSPKTYPICK